MTQISEDQGKVTDMKNLSFFLKDVIIPIRLVVIDIKRRQGKMAFLQVQFFSNMLNVASTVNVILPEPEQGIGIRASKDMELPPVVKPSEDCLSVISFAPTLEVMMITAFLKLTFLP